MRGSLEDLEMQSVLEFFRANRQTGELIVAGSDGFAKIQLFQGKVTGAELDGEHGIAALLKVLAWREGEFEFRRENLPPENVAGTDLLPAITLIRNNGPLPAEGASPPLPLAVGLQREAAAPPPRCDAHLAAQLQETLATAPSTWYLAVLDPAGNLRAEARSDLISQAGVEECQPALRSILLHYPQPRLERLILEIPPLVLVAGRIRQGDWLLLASDRHAHLGGTLRFHQKLAEILS